MIESIFYAIGRGFARAWLDVQKEQRKVDYEQVTDSAVAAGGRMRDVVRMHLDGESGQDDYEPPGAAPTLKGCGTLDCGAETERLDC